MRRVPTARVASSLISRLSQAAHTPGLQYLVIGSDGVLFEHSTGWADLKARLPLTAATTLMAYSMSKPVTALACLRLVEAGRLELDEAVERFVDPFPYGLDVTVRRLLAHTSGVPNPIPLRWVHPAEQHATFDERSALTTVLRAHPRLSSSPGTKYAYSNIGYWLLARVIERVGGESFTDYVTRHVFQPLNIEPHELAYTVPDHARHATGYLEKYSLMNVMKWFLIDPELIGRYAGRWLEIRNHYPNGAAFGGLVGNAAGFGKFLQAQLRPPSTVVSDAMRGWLFTAERTTAGTLVPMTLGWHIGTRRGTPFYFKEGGGGGFRCLMRLYRSDGIGTLVMTNATGFNVHQFLDAVDRLFLDSRAS